MGIGTFEVVLAASFILGPLQSSVRRTPLEDDSMGLFIYADTDAAFIFILNFLFIGHGLGREASVEKAFLELLLAYARLDLFDGLLFHPS